MAMDRVSANVFYDLLQIFAHDPRQFLLTDTDAGDIKVPIDMQWIVDFYSYGEGTAKVQRLMIAALEAAHKLKEGETCTVNGHWVIERVS